MINAYEKIRNYHFKIEISRDTKWRLCFYDALQKILNKDDFECFGKF